MKMRRRVPRQLDGYRYVRPEEFRTTWIYEYLSGAFNTIK